MEEMNMNIEKDRSRAKTRHNCWRKALRKRRIIRQYGIEYYDNLHQYSKNKIHCSCPICSRETWHQGDNSKERLKISDQRKLNNINEQIKFEEE